METTVAGATPPDAPQPTPSSSSQPAETTTNEVKCRSFSRKIFHLPTVTLSPPRLRRRGEFLASGGVDCMLTWMVSQSPDGDINLLDMDDESLDTDRLKEKLKSISKKRKELQQMEIELRARIMARTELMQKDNKPDLQVVEHDNAQSKVPDLSAVPNSLTHIQSYESDGDVPDSVIQDGENGRSETIEWDCTSSFLTDEVFQSRDELTAWCKSVGKTCGVVIGIKKSDNPKYGRRGRIIYWCERSGVYQEKKRKMPSEKPIKRTGTKKCGCPFLLKGVKLPDGDQWKVQVVCGRHNHPAEKSTTFRGHSYVGRLSKSEEQIVINMSICGVKPKEILRVIKEANPDNASTIETIYNFKAKHRIAEK